MGSEPNSPSSFPPVALSVPLPPPSHYFIFKAQDNGVDRVRGRCQGPPSRDRRWPRIRSHRLEELPPWRPLHPSPVRFDHTYHYYETIPFISFFEQLPLSPTLMPSVISFRCADLFSSLRYDKKDATDVFSAFHGPEAYARLKKLKGVPVSVPIDPKVAAFR